MTRTFDITVHDDKGEAEPTTKMVLRALHLTYPNKAFTVLNKNSGVGPLFADRAALPETPPAPMSNAPWNDDRYRTAVTLLLSEEPSDVPALVARRAAAEWLSAALRVRDNPRLAQEFDRKVEAQP